MRSIQHSTTNDIPISHIYNWQTYYITELKRMSKERSLSNAQHYSHITKVPKRRHSAGFLHRRRYFNLSTTTPIRRPSD
jgi:hypothetical protein